MLFLLQLMEYFLYDDIEGKWNVCGVKKRVNYLNINILKS